MDINSGMVTFEWIYAHLGLVGWPALIAIAWKASSWFSQLTAQATKTVGQIDKMAVNCFPTMQRSLENQDGLMHSMDQSLKLIAERTPEKAKRASKSRA